MELTGIGVTVLLPDSWAGQYEVVQDSFLPYNSAMWEFCAKSVYEDETFYRGSLFTVFQYADYSMSAEEFAQSGLAGIGRYLFATEDATYAVMYAGDVQFDPANAAQQETWYALSQTLQEVRFVITPMAE